MRKRVVFIFIQLYLMLAFVCSDGGRSFEKTDLVLKTEAGNVIVYAKFANSEKKIINEFFMVFENVQNEKDGEKLAILINGIIRDKYGNIIMDLSHLKNKFYGFTITPSYPKSKRFSPGFNLDPYFGSSDNVGDTQRIQWDATSNTFQKNPSRVP